MSQIPKPPAGYVSWLDYAVANMDTRSAFLEECFKHDSDEPIVQRDAMQRAVEQELRELRAAAGVIDTYVPFN